MTDSLDWSIDGRNILTPDRLAKIKNEIENIGPVIVEHWFYFGSRAPDRLVFDDFDILIEYLHANSRPGDAIHIWSYASLCRDDNGLADGKIPDQHGRVPSGGSY
jgi:hypothetical protein